MKRVKLSTSVLIWAITQSHAFSWTKIRQDESLAQARSSPIRDDVWSSGELAVILNAGKAKIVSFVI
ncbi:hypothetical protein PHLCEN_2v8607 [Hermanssonia centrifuga]|uniref:Uncharacterized protein n=1 Tax=Hermanssonia centrifuga TaxID=98765 RepID=A0A2R6NT53_9APHY|nr:hypothetical protein PHLCEN_2v8607 [Hermanssonia centrifuga]